MGATGVGMITDQVQADAADGGTAGEFGGCFAVGGQQRAAVCSGRPYCHQARAMSCAAGRAAPGVGTVRAASRGACGIAAGPVHADPVELDLRRGDHVPAEADRPARELVDGAFGVADQLQRTVLVATGGGGVRGAAVTSTSSSRFSTHCGGLSARPHKG